MIAYFTQALVNQCNGSWNILYMSTEDMWGREGRREVSPWKGTIRRREDVIFVSKAEGGTVIYI